MNERPPAALVKVVEAIRNQIIYAKTEFPVLDELDMERENIGRSDLILYLNHLVMKGVIHGWFAYIVLRGAVPPPETEREELFWNRPHDWDLNDRAKIQFIVALHEKELIEEFYKSLLSKKPWQSSRTVEYDPSTGAYSFSGNSYIPESKDRKAFLAIFWANRRVIIAGKETVSGEAMQKQALAAQIDLITEAAEFTKAKKLKLKQLITNLNTAFATNLLPLHIRSIGGNAILIEEHQ